MKGSECRRQQRRGDERGQNVGDNMKEGDNRRQDEKWRRDEAKIGAKMRQSQFRGIGEGMTFSVGLPRFFPTPRSSTSNSCAHAHTQSYDLIKVREEQGGKLLTPIMCVRE